MRVFRRAVLFTVAMGLLMACASSSEARFFRRSLCPPTSCEPCDCCRYYNYSPGILAEGKEDPVHRQVKVGHGVIVQFRVPNGNPQPIDSIVVTQYAASTPAGQVKYTGWNKHLENPIPGSPYVYSIFLCPEAEGDCHVNVFLFHSGNTMPSKTTFKITVLPN